MIAGTVINRLTFEIMEGMEYCWINFGRMALSCGLSNNGSTLNNGR